jgi:hypothetical protein
MPVEMAEVMATYRRHLSDGLKSPAVPAKLGTMGRFTSTVLPVHAFETIGLGNEDLATRQTHLLFLPLYISPHCRFADVGFAHLTANPPINKARRVPLLPRCLPIAFQDRVNETLYRSQPRLFALRLLPFPRQCRYQRLAHCSPVHTQLSGHRSDRAFTMLKLPSDLLK